MANSFNTVWRVIFTGLSFFLFGLGGVLLGVIVFPFLFWVRHAKRRQYIARRVVQYTFKLFIEFMRFFGVLSYEISGFQALNKRQGVLIIANHPTLLDTVFLMSLLNGVDCIVKADLFRNPFTRGPVKAAGYIPNNSERAEEMIQACIDQLVTGQNILIFPEGTRSITNQPYRLQRGAANIAVRAQVDLVPIHIRCTPPTLRKGEKWYNVPPRKMHFNIKVQEDIEIDQYLQTNPTLAARRLTDDIAHLFTEYDTCPI